jgi:hypothetical protein
MGNEGKKQRARPRITALGICRAVKDNDLFADIEFRENGTVSNMRIERRSAVHRASIRPPEPGTSDELTAHLDRLFERDRKQHRDGQAD